MISIYLQIRLAEKLLDQTVTYLSQGWSILASTVFAWILQLAQLTK